MTMRGRCRCGCILIFPLTRTGYKQVCPQCKSVVRLKASQKQNKRRASPPKIMGKSAEGWRKCSCGEMIQVSENTMPEKVTCPFCHGPIVPGVSTDSGDLPLPVFDNDETNDQPPLSTEELESLSRELSANDPVSESELKEQSVSGWERGVQVCQSCGELLGMGANTCRHCGYAS